MVELGADDARRTLVARIVSEDQGAEGSGAEGRACGLQLHEAESAAALMARSALGYEYTGDDDTSRMPGDEVDDDDIVDRLARIFKDMPAYTSCPIPEYSAARPPNKVSIHIPSRVLIT
jgi:hypothetical protein